MTLSLDLAPLLLGGLAAVRVLTFVMAIPGMGARTVPVAVKIGLALWVAAATLPGMLAAGVVPPLTPATLALAVAGEFLAGLLLAFVVVTVFATVQLAGELIGLQIGFAIVNVFDPVNQSQNSIVGELYFLFAALVFAALDGPARVVVGVAQSFQVLPPGRVDVFGSGVLPLVDAFAGVFSAALRISLPPLTALLLVSVAMGVLGRSVPQLNLLVVGFPLRIIAGLLVMAALFPLLGRLVEVQLSQAFRQLVDVAALLATPRW